MRPKAVIFSISFAFVLALSLILVPQDVSASGPSYSASGTPNVAGGIQSLYIVVIHTEGQAYPAGSTVHVEGYVYSDNLDTKGPYVMVTLEDDNGQAKFQDLTVADKGLFKADLVPTYEIVGNYTVKAVADALDTKRVNDTISVSFVAIPPEPEVEEDVDPLIYIQIGALFAAFASMAVASTESAGFSFFNIFAFPMYSRLKKEEVLDHFVRGQIYGFIVSNPGEHYNSIREKLKMTNGTLSYHLRTLEVQGFIKSRKESIYRRFYPVEMRFPRDKGVKLSDLQIAMLELTNRRPAPTQKEIASELEISQQVASYNLRILARKGYVQVHKDGRKRMYYQIEPESPTSL